MIAVKLTIIVIVVAATFIRIGIDVLQIIRNYRDDDNQ